MEGTQRDAKKIQMTSYLRVGSLLACLHILKCKAALQRGTKEPETVQLYCKRI